MSLKMFSDDQLIKQAIVLQQKLPEMKDFVTWSAFQKTYNAILVECEERGIHIEEGMEQ